MVLNRFITDQSNTIELIEQAIEAEAWREAIRYAHSLKGVAGTIGAETLQLQAADIESLLVAQDKQAIPLEPLKSALQAVVVEISAALQSEEKDDSVTTSDPAVSAGWIEPLQKLLEQVLLYDTAALDEINVLLPSARGSAIEQPLQKIRQQLEQYDFEKAQQQIEWLIEQAETVNE